MKFRDQVVSALARFETMFPDGIAWTLQQEGIVGTPDSTDKCVMAVYLGVGEVQVDMRRLPNSLPTGTYYVKLVDRYGKSTEEIDLPKNLSDFVSAFDDYRYPELLEPDYRNDYFWQNEQGEWVRKEEDDEY